MLDLQQVGCWPADAHGTLDGVRRPLVPGAWADVDIEFEATTWTLVPGHVLRLAIAGTDWPNCWPPAEPFTLGVDRSSIVLSLPVADVPASTHVRGGPDRPTVNVRASCGATSTTSSAGSRVVRGTAPLRRGPGIEVDDSTRVSSASAPSISATPGHGRSRFDLTLQTDRVPPCAPPRPGCTWCPTATPSTSSSPSWPN
jgi:hypothetical protein